jgi:4-diphosphocytidyl-2-C-methyl-D-erythritol kinase
MMIACCNAKINLGLTIKGKRSDGYHEVETLVYPIPLFDVIEIKPAEQCMIQTYGLDIGCKQEENLIWKTWELLRSEFRIPPFEICLLKNIPIESGLGGGSSDAASFLKLVNTSFKLGLSIDKQKDLISAIGSDCPFFIENSAAFSRGRGEILEKTDFTLQGKWLVLIKPVQSISTATAYNLVKKTPGHEKAISALVSQPIGSWPDILVNDFEIPVFGLYPELAEIKSFLYGSGAVYASLSGSGTAIFGLFDRRTSLSGKYEKMVIWSGFLN